MFICEECAEKSLSEEGKQGFWMRSLGRCELCEKTAGCVDVPSRNNWAWKSDEEDDDDARAPLERTEEDND